MTAPAVDPVAQHAGAVHAHVHEYGPGTHRVPDHRPRATRLRGPVALAGLVMTASVALHLRDPHRSGSWGGCPWLAVTGTDCPGCGGLRAVNDLTNFRAADAASSNLLFIGSLPFIAYYLSRWAADRWQGVQRFTVGNHVAIRSYMFTGAISLWWVVRNLPGLEWLRSGF